MAPPRPAAAARQATSSAGTDRSRLALLVAARATSALGDYASIVALPLVALALGGRASSVALVLAANRLPVLAAPTVAPWAQGRVRALRTLPVLLLAQGVVAGLLAAAALSGELRLWSLVVAATVLGSVDALVEPVGVSALADLAHGPGVARVLALDDLLVRVSRLGGPLLAAGVASLWSVPAVLVADAVSFGLAAALSVAVPVATVTAADDSAGLRRVLAVVRGLPDVAAGWRLRGIGCFVWGSYSVGVPVLVTGIPGNDVTQLAAVTGGYAVGSLVGSGVLSARPLRGQLLPVVCAAWAGVGVAFMVMGASGVLAVLVGAAALAGTVIPAANVSVTTLVARSTHGALRRSALGAQAAVVNGSSTAGLVVVGGLLGVIGPGTVMLAAGAGLVAVSGFVFLRSR